MTHEEFLESRRKSDFKAPYSKEETQYWMEQQIKQAIENASGRRFPRIGELMEQQKKGKTL